MTAAPPRLLERLDAAIALACHPVDAACLRAQRAGLLARHGCFEQAQAEILDLHRAFDAQPVPAISAWLCMAEGWMLHFESLSAHARDKMMRAQALSAAGGVVSLQALSHAWVAHMDYIDDDVDGMVRHLGDALRLAAADDHATRARAAIVAALGYHFADRLERAQPWYVSARGHAMADGDDTTLSAINFNIASQHADQAMQAAVIGGDAAERVRLARSASDAAGNFDEWIGTASLGALLPLQHAGLACADGEWREALDLYEKHVDAAQAQGLSRRAAIYLADMAWCRCQLGDRHGAERDARAAAGRIDCASGSDDRALAHGRLAMLFKLLGDADESLAHAAQSRQHWAMHRRFQASMLATLEAAQLQP